MAKLICQSCGMPLTHDSFFGTEEDGTKCIKYCHRCYQKGNFTEPSLTADEMQEKVIAIMKSSMHIPPFVGKHLAREVPQLERWQTAVK